MPALEDHPLSEIFPLMGDADLAALADDIEANGLRDPVWLYEGKILDGRNRYRACRLKDIDHRVEHYKGRDPLGFVISKNLHRRHLTESQRAMVAANIANAKEGRRPVTSGIPLVTQTQAAGMLGVSVDSVKDAKTVKEQGVPELVEAVVKGEVSVSAAAEVAKLPKAEQKKAVKAGNVKDKAKERRQARAVAKLADPEPTTVEPAPEAVVNLGTAGKCRDAAGDVIRRLKQIKELYSGLMAGDYAEQVKSLAGGYRSVAPTATGELLKSGAWGTVTYGIAEYTCDAFDELMQFFGALKLVFDRIDRQPVDRPAAADLPDWSQVGVDREAF